MKDLFRALIASAVLFFVVGLVYILASSSLVDAVVGCLVACCVLFAACLKRPPRVQTSWRKVHFPGLNGVRFLAAVLVLLHHVEVADVVSGPDRHYGPALLRIGDLGVSCFFVLSGFLITYLLLAENAYTGTISIKDFYIRRALRILPLYYVVTIFGFFLLPHLPFLDAAPSQSMLGEAFWSRFALFMAMTPHLCRFEWGASITPGILWSTGVEEHFYFIWPWIVRFLKNRLLFALIAIVPVMALLKQSVLIWYYQIDPKASLDTLKFMQGIGTYFSYFRVDCMAIGGLGAWLYFHRSKLLSFFYHRIVQIIALTTLVYCAAKGVAFGFLDDDVYALLFIIVIVNVSTNPASLLKLENPLFDYLGKISYGLYAFNWVAIAIAYNIIRRLGGVDGYYLRHVFAYIVSFSLLIGFASASYFFFERKFLRMKSSYRSLSASDLASEFPPTGPETAPAAA